MIDFAREEEELEATVGVATHAIVAEVGPAYVDKLHRVRQRYAALSLQHALGGPERQRLDRYESLWQHLYGSSGVLRRAGALLTLRQRLQRISGAAQHALTSLEDTARLRREALFARTFAREQIARGQGVASARIAETVAAAAKAITALDDFCAEVAARTTEHTQMWQALGLSATGDVTASTPRSIAEGVAFVLHRLAESSYVQAAGTQLDRVCAASASALRDDLWEAAERAYARRAGTATHAELEDLDTTLEALRTRLLDPRSDAVERAAAIAQLHALVASARANDAVDAIEAELRPVLELVRQGLDSES